MKEENKKRKAKKLIREFNKIHSDYSSKRRGLETNTKVCGLEKWTLVLERVRFSSFIQQICQELKI